MMHWQHSSHRRQDYRGQTLTESRPHTDSSTWLLHLSQKIINVHKNAIKFLNLTRVNNVKTRVSIKNNENFEFLKGKN